MVSKTLQSVSMLNPSQTYLPISKLLPLILIASGCASPIDYFGNELCTLIAPEDGMIFGLRALPNVTIGEWCCFFAIIEGEW